MKEEVSYNTSDSFDRFNDEPRRLGEDLKDSGLQFDFMAYGDLENGALISRGLPHLRAADELCAER